MKAITERELKDKEFKVELTELKYKLKDLDLTNTNTKASGEPIY